MWANWFSDNLRRLKYSIPNLNFQCSPCFFSKRFIQFTAVQKNNLWAACKNLKHSSTNLFIFHTFARNFFVLNCTAVKRFILIHKALLTNPILGRNVKYIYLIEILGTSRELPFWAWTERSKSEISLLSVSKIKLWHSIEEVHSQNSGLLVVPGLSVNW